MSLDDLSKMAIKKRIAERLPDGCLACGCNDFFVRVADKPEMFALSDEVTCVVVSECSNCGFLHLFASRRLLGD